MPKMVYKVTMTRSVWLLIYLILSHLIFLATLLSVVENSVLMFTICSCLILSFVYFCDQYQWLRRRSNVSLECDSDNNWTVSQQNGVLYSSLQLTQCVETSFIIILGFKQPLRWQAYYLTIMSDAVDAESFRQLRLICRQAKTFQQ